MIGRILAPSDYIAVMEAFEQLVQLCGGIEPASAATRVNPSQVASYYDRTRPRRMPPADVVADLERFTRTPIVTAELARLAGYALVLLEPVDGTQLAAAIAESARDSAEVPAVFLEASADGLVTAEEASRVQRKALKAKSSLAQVAMIAGALARAAFPFSPRSPSASPGAKDGGASAGRSHSVAVGGGCPQPHQHHPQHTGSAA